MEGTSPTVTVPVFTDIDGDGNADAVFLGAALFAGSVPIP